MAVDYAKEGQIALITINRPDVMNALDAVAFRELREALERFRDDPEAWVGIMTGAGEKAFSAGADLKAMGTTIAAAAASGDSEARNAHRYALTTGLNIWKPLIAAINGYCLGAGLEIALTCDIRLAAENARFGMPEVRRGFIPGMGGTQRLPRMLHWCHAAELLLTGRHVDAQRALRMGLVNDVLPLDKLMPTARDWASVLLEAAPLAARAAKEAMVRGYSLPLEEALDLEHRLGERTHNTEDFREGHRAFVENRKPDWKGE